MRSFTITWGLSGVVMASPGCLLSLSTSWQDSIPNCLPTKGEISAELLSSGLLESLSPPHAQLREQPRKWRKPVCSFWRSPCPNIPASITSCSGSPDSQQQLGFQLELSHYTLYRSASALKRKALRTSLKILPLFQMLSPFQLWLTISFFLVPLNNCSIHCL